MSFESWKKLKIKSDPTLKNTSQISPVKNDENRFNFASIDCAAKVVKTNEGAQESKSILMENKDSYLVNKCSTKDQFLIIELCQDILIDLIEIGNFEFFSSNFKRFKVSVNERYEDTNWKSLGEFEASNSRTLQKFKIINPLIWAKFIKIEILEHYGSEFYCPISLVKVYGKTMLEEFKEQTIEQPSVETDECKINSTLPYLGLNEFLNSIPEYCEVVEEESTATNNPQDSIFKNIIKRLSLLESNASLSLLYIEEQSRLLSDSFRKLQMEQSHDLDKLLWNFNQTFNQQMLKINQFNQFKLFESNKVISNLANDLSFYKKLLLVNFVLLTVLVCFLLLSKDLPVEIPIPRNYQFKVGSTKKKYKKKSKYRF
ncbi:hypothetical protein CANTEDRAFT_96012 [Yamadazyma tenuis ATCC 10573]|uniref:SUN-like protein 1 n=2 Tax=Candida tenuis TaxID=2315449 RepID=G3BEK4_CANTC|nr:uncharacterized protein CANTEDRAFT_96012 [Yamadazyma tenuis ATCC 10573]EGV60566.1 hypothetical protein CANTEDRAFT_96012 [Yamadazyma tenuis ATCC 10573]